MSQSVTYPSKNSFKGRLAILTIQSLTCGFHELKRTCVQAGASVDPETGHRVCSGCHRITVASGLRTCDICNREYIDPNKYQNPRYDTNCPSCVIEYGLEDV